MSWTTLFVMTNWLIILDLFIIHLLLGLIKSQIISYLLLYECTFHIGSLRLILWLHWFCIYSTILLKVTLVLWLKQDVLFLHDLLFVFKRISLRTYSKWSCSIIKISWVLEILIEKCFRRLYSSHSPIIHSSILLIFIVLIISILW